MHPAGFIGKDWVCENSSSRSHHRMQLTTILNRVEYFKSFVYGKAKWVENAARPTIEVPIEARKNGRPICSVCESACAELRPAAPAAFRVRAFVGDYDLFHLCDAEGRVSKVRRESGKGSLVRRQEPTDHDLSLVPCRLGAAAFMERGRRRLRHELAKRVSLGKTRGFLGIGAARPGGYQRQSAWTRSNGNAGHKYLTLVYQIPTRTVAVYCGPGRTAR